MNYYEELGVPEDAPVGEIRQAYRMLARILHPDGQPEERLRFLAERQMKRLNHILAILADPVERRRYDRSLSRKQGAGLCSFEPGQKVKEILESAREAAFVHFVLRHWVWIVIGLMAAGSAGWYVARQDPGLQRTISRPPPATVENAVAPRSGGREPGRAKPRPAASSRTLRTIIPPEDSPVLPEFDLSRPEAPGLSPPPVEVALPPIVPLGLMQSEGETPPSSVTVPAATPSPLAGRWLYLPQAASKSDRDLYPPEYIELLLTEENGTLKGSYYARYRITDKPISPEVRFSLQGSASGGSSATLKWVSSDRAEGDVELVLRSPDTLAVTWRTVIASKQTALISGRAWLVRQQVY